jgi:hypothetical protein
MNNDLCKVFKKYAFGTKKLKNNQKLQFIWTYENMVTIQKSLTIKTIRVFK